MTSGLRLLAVVALLGTGMVACSDDKGGGGKFVGNWTYSGAIIPNCIALTVDPIDLTGVTVTIMSSDDTHVSVALGTYCTVTFDVDGSTATASPGQTCSFDIPSLGPQTVMITKWTMTISGDTIMSSFMGAVAICTPAGTGTLTRQSDAGASD